MPLNLSTFEVPELVDEVMSEFEPIIRRSTLRVAQSSATSGRSKTTGRR